MTLEVRPVSADRWDELAAFFGPSGALSHCWCTWWRQTSADFSRGVQSKGELNRAFLHTLVETGSEPGLLGYRDGRAVGWVSVAPRPQYGRLLRSRRIRPPADEAADDSVWSIVCFWIPRAERGHGVATDLLTGSVEHARAQGATVLEAYPVDTAGGRHPAANLFTGTLAMFRRAGFVEVDRPRGGQLIVRRAL